MLTVIRPILRQSASRLLFRNPQRCINSKVMKSYQVVSISTPQYHQLRFKSKKQPTKLESASDSAADSVMEDELADKNTKIVDISVKSTRIDGILKATFGISRNKSETLFYESKIRVNGEKLLKKSETAQEGDEIDVVKSPSPTNPDFLIVARTEILKISEKGDTYVLKVRRSKNVTIEKYE